MSDMTYWCESCARKNNCYTIRSKPKCFTPITSNDRKADRKTENNSEKPNNCEEQTVECPFDDAIPCEWVCTEYANCKYKPQTDYKKWDAPPKVDLPTGEITTCVSVLASALDIEDDPQTKGEV